MRVAIVPLTDFVHGEINAREGRQIVIDSGVASDLERAGLVRVRMAPAQAKAEQGKAEDDGQGQPSSASQAAPVLQDETSQPLKRGPGRPRKNVEPSS